MDSNITLLTSFDTDYLFVILLAALFTIEQILEKGNAIKKNSVHLFHSILLQTGYIFLNIALASVFVLIFDWVSDNKIGLLYQFEMPYILKIGIGILALDFVGYWTHIISTTNGISFGVCIAYLTAITKWTVPHPFEHILWT